MAAYTATHCIFSVIFLNGLLQNNKWWCAKRFADWVWAALQQFVKLKTNPEDAVGGLNPIHYLLVRCRLKKKKITLVVYQPASLRTWSDFQKECGIVVDLIINLCVCSWFFFLPWGVSALFFYCILSELFTPKQ